MTKDTFEDYLQEKHCEQYIGTKDSMCDDFNDWLVDLDPQELIDYGDEFATQEVKKEQQRWIKASEVVTINPNQN